jgi:hypothetical protein
MGQLQLKIANFQSAISSLEIPRITACAEARLCYVLCPFSEADEKSRVLKGKTALKVPAPVGGGGHNNI